MEKESLEKVTDIIIRYIELANIPLYDKVELLLNLRLFLKDYDKNIKILGKEVNNEKRI